MALCLADVGADQVLKVFFNHDVPASLHLRIKLFTNNVVPVDTFTTADFTEADGGGYVANGKQLANGAWVVNVANDPSDAVFAAQTWTFTGPLTAGATIYGYYVVDDDGAGVLIWAELLTATFTPASNGDQVIITPKFRLSKGVPA